MKTILSLLLFLFVAVPCQAQVPAKAPSSGRQQFSFKTDWKFLRLDPSPTVGSASSAASGNPASAAFDGDPNTYWHTPWGEKVVGYPHWIQRDLLKRQTLDFITLLPRQDGNINGRIRTCEVTVSDDGTTWSEPVAKGTFPSSAALSKVNIEPPATGRYLRVIVNSGEGGGPFASLAELGIHVKDGGFVGAPGEENSDTGFAEHGFTDRSWETVNLPHTPAIEAKELENQWQGVCWYRRHFSALPGWKGKRVTVMFEAAMQVAEVHVNGRKVTEHVGGYLPFTVDLTDLIDYKPGANNVIAVRLDNRDNPLVPPGKPLSSMDLTYQGGLYRNVWLTVTNPVHITDPVTAGQVASGGVFVQYPKVSNDLAALDVRTHVANEDSSAANCVIESVLTDRMGRAVATTTSQPITLAPTSNRQIRQTLQVREPRLWSPDSPYLYTLRSSVMRGGKLLDRTSTQLGIRAIAWKTDGFSLNGKRLLLNGANRHQDNIYIGNAAPDAMQWRDARLLKDAGFNAIRAGHTPLSPAFMDACDELGLVVIACTPGWQHYNSAPLFSERVFQNIRDMIRRDRNRPSIVLWETILNETWYPENFALAGLAVANEELPGIATASDHGLPGAAKFTVNYKTPDGKMPLVTREWGDAHRYAGLSGGTWGDWGDRADEASMVYQSYARQRSLNGDDYWDWIGVNANTNTGGYFLWIGIDHNRGSTSQIARCGPLEIDRSPKFSYYFHQSQSDPASPLGPMVFIANYRTPTSPADVAVFSNASQVRLSLGGRVLAIQEPDKNYTEAGRTRPLSHVPHPIFTFHNVPRSDLPLKAEALIAGQVVATHSVTPPGPARRLAARFDHPGQSLSADGSDSGMLFLSAGDKNGTLVPSASVPITVKIQGPGRLLGANPVTTEGGLAAIWVQADTRPGLINVTATAPGLEPVVWTTASRPSSLSLVPLPTGWKTSPRPTYERPLSKTETTKRPELPRLTGVTVRSASTGRPDAPAHLAADGNRETAWIARDETSPSLVLDLGSVRKIKESRIIWEKDSTWYQFTIETSADGQSWKQVYSGSESGQDFAPENWQARDARYVRVTILSVVPTNSLRGIREIELF